MLSLLLLLACQTINDDPAPIDHSSPRVEPAGVVVTFDSPPVQTTERKKLIVYSRKFGCVPCQQMLAEIGDGDDELEIVWEYENIPSWVEVVPTVYNPERKVQLQGRLQMSQLRKWVGLPAFPAAKSQPVTGSISNLDKYLEPLKYVQNISGTFSEESIDLGSVSVQLNRADWQLIVVDGGQSLTLRFTSRKPSVRRGIVSMQVNGVTLKGDTLTVDVPGPDWSLKIKE